jgi:hypothetical protein
MKIYFKFFFFFFFTHLVESQEVRDTLEFKKVIDEVINDIDNKFNIIKPYDLYMLDESLYKLNPNFISRIRAAMLKYSELKPSSDSLVNLKYKLNSSRKKFKNFLTNDELNYFYNYENSNKTIDYKNFIDNKKVYFLDSLSFFNKNILDFGEVFRLKIILKGPFLSDDNTKALVEIYKVHDSTTLFLIYVKKENEWEMFGNVNF